MACGLPAIATACVAPIVAPPCNRRTKEPATGASPAGTLPNAALHPRITFRKNDPGAPWLPRLTATRSCQANRHKNTHKRSPADNPSIHAAPNGCWEIPTDVTGRTSLAPDA